MVIKDRSLTKSVGITTDEILQFFYSERETSPTAMELIKESAKTNRAEWKRFGRTAQAVVAATSSSVFAAPLQRASAQQHLVNEFPATAACDEF